jgi:hypothetical protein
MSAATDALLQQLDPIVLLDRLVPQLAVRTRYGPDLIFEHPFGPDAEPGESPVAWLKPALDVSLYGGGRKTVAPWGDPGETDWPTVKVLGILGGLTIVGLGAAWFLGR